MIFVNGCCDWINSPVPPQNTTIIGESKELSHDCVLTKDCLQLSTGIYIFGCQDISCSELPMSTSALSFQVGKFPGNQGSREDYGAWRGWRWWDDPTFVTVTLADLRRKNQDPMPNRPSGWKHPAVRNFLECSVHRSKSWEILHTKRLLLAPSYRRMFKKSCWKGNEAICRTFAGRTLSDVVISKA